MTRGRGWGTAAILALLAGGCSNVPKNMVVLLDQPDGRPSAVIFKSKAGSQVVDKPGLATGVDASGDKPRDPFQLEQEEFTKRFAGALGAAPVPPRSFQLYFKFDSTDLTDESRAQLPKILEEMKGRPAPEVTARPEAGSRHQEPDRRHRRRPHPRRRHLARQADAAGADRRQHIRAEEPPGRSDGAIAYRPRR
jgi:hypothetical protein